MIYHWITKSARVLFIVGFLPLAVGCFRYVPSQKEVQSKNTSANSAPSEGLLGEDAFFAHERLLKERLKSLIDERARLVSNPSDDTYRVGSGDVLEYDVQGLPELRAEIEVPPSGAVLFSPLNEEIAVKGRSLVSIKAALAEKLRRYVKSPQLRLTVREYRGHQVAVTGAVAKPGMYPLKRGAPLLSEVIAEAGGRTDKAGNRVILVPAAFAGQHAAQQFGIEVDAEDLIGSASAPPVLLPVLSGDTVIVPEAGTYEVEGEVKTPGSFKITSKKTVMGAIAAAGGFGYAARVNEVEVVRDVGSGKKAYVALNMEDIALKGGEDVRIRDGDLVRVPTDSSRHLKRQIVESLNSVFRGVGVQGQVR